MTAATTALFPAHTTDFEKEFDEVRAGYPNQIGREQALKYYVADRLELGADVAGRIQAAKRNYLAFLKRQDQAWRSAQNLKTFFGNWRDWEPAAQPERPSDPTREDLIRQHAVEVAAFIAIEGDPDESPAARERFESWAASFVRESDEGRWNRWRAACAEVGIDPKGRTRPDIDPRDWK